MRLNSFQGSDGLPGEVGLMGDKGEWLFGPKGMPGDTGDIGEIGEPSTLILEFKYPNAIGLKGRRGPPGYKGDTGSHGRQGPPGVKGPPVQ